MKKSLIIFILFYAHAVMAQIDLQFISTINGEKLALNKSYFVESINDSIIFSKLKFYISHVSIGGNDKENKVKDYFLYDLAEDKIGFLFETNLDDVQQINFTLGIDSLTNAAGAHGGDLDPVHGMYWAWQSGYIHFKLEGSTPVSTARDHKIQYHVGGFLGDSNTERKISLPFKNKEDKITIYFPLDEFINKQNLATEHTVMSPGDSAMRQADELMNLFNCKQ